MVRLIPEDPTFTTASEQEVWERLRSGLGGEDVLLAGVRLTDEKKDHEADLVVLMPEVGILVVEVKGGSVWLDEHGWKQKSRGKQRGIDPVEQVRTTKYAIRDYVSRDERWQRRNHVAWGHAVVTPYAEFAADAESPDCPRWALHDRGDQADLAERLVANAKYAWQGKVAPTYDEVDLIVQILSGRLHTTYDVNADAEDRAAESDRLTQEQASILKVTRLLKRVEVRGGAGSGKTVLALQQAKELTRGVGEQKAQRVGLLCYSIGLAEYLKREVASWPRKHRPAFVGTFHEFGKQWGAPEGDRQDSVFWEETLPALMGELAGELTDNVKFDAVVVDEAQDFADSWWRPVLKSLRDEVDGGLYVFSDENQRIFARFGRPPVELVPLVLDHNLRNTKQIHDCFGPLAPSRMYSRGGDGPEVKFVPAAADDALGAADDQVEALVDVGWKPENICLLTTGHRHPEQEAQTDRHGQVEYWRSFWDGEDVFYGHVLGSKGLERRVVVLCLNETGERDRARERLYVGMSRATDMLVVVGEPEVVRRVGGDQVARSLGIS